MARIPPDGFLVEFVTARAEALRNIYYPDATYHWRRICRWAAAELNISIYDAQAMPINELLQHYHEARLEGLDREDLDNLREKVLETPEQAKARESEQIEEEEELDDLVAQLQRQNEANKKAKAAKAISKAPKPPQDIPDLSKMPPDVSVKFEDPEGLPQDAWDILGPPKGNL